MSEDKKVISIFAARKRKEEAKESPKTDRDEAIKEHLLRTMERNAKNKKREEEDRRRRNKSVTRDYRLKD